MLERFGLAVCVAALALVGAQTAKAAGWTVQLAASPGGVGVLQGVSCGSAHSCTAVGRYIDATDTSQPVAEGWAGGVWRLEVTPLPVGAVGGELDGVWCGRVVCEGVGFADFAGGQARPLAERWDGSSWTLQSVPLPSGASGGTLASVSCVRDAFCKTVGVYGGPLGPVGPLGSLTETWDGNAWSIDSTPGAMLPTADLSGVSCASSTACAAVGYNPAAQWWDGASWMTSSTSEDPVGFAGVSCVAVSFCSAVGGGAGSPVGSGGGGVPVAEVWRGSGWVKQRVPAPVTATALSQRESRFDGVACNSPRSCTAAGYSSNVNGESAAPLAEVWNGVGWVIQPTPNPGVQPYGYFRGVSCWGTACTAVGFGGTGLLIERRAS